MDRKYKNLPIVKETSVVFRTKEKIKFLEDIYTVKNFMEVKKFLKEHKNLTEILFEVHKQIKKIFGEVVELCLELHRDPVENFEGLFVIIKTNLSPEESLNLLDKFDEEWWLDVDISISNILEVTVEPV